MLLVLPTSHLDAPAAQRLLDWISEIKTPTEKHELIIAASKRVDISTIKSPFEKTSFFVPHDEDERGWPQSPNHLFKRLCQHITWNVRKPFLWFEADCVPIVPSWIDQIEAEYNSCGQPFMGARVVADNVPLHMSGNAVYPSDVLHRATYICKLNRIAWDVACAEDIIPQAHWTELIQHIWSQKRDFDFPDQKSVTDVLKPKTVLFHQCKNPSMIERLREMREASSK